MPQNDAQVITLNDWNSGDPLTADHLQEPIDVLRQITRAVGEPFQVAFDTEFSDISGVRLVVTSNAVARSGLAAIDSVIPQAGDLVGYFTGGTPGADGIYEAQAGAWKMRARISAQQAGNAPVLPHNWVISVGDGASGPQIWVTGISGTTRSF